MVYRQPIKTPEVLTERMGQAAELYEFMAGLRALSAQASLPVDLVFQSLLASLAELGRAPSLGADFNMQAGSTSHLNEDFVPMHQAKVLDRSERNKANDAEVKRLAGDRLGWLVDCADLMRKLLRVKVEDGNDLLMAFDTVDEVHKFWERLQALSTRSGEAHFALYQRLITM